MVVTDYLEVKKYKISVEWLYDNHRVNINKKGKEILQIIKFSINQCIKYRLKLELAVVYEGRTIYYIL